METTTTPIANEPAILSQNMPNHKNKKKQKITMAKLYDNMISTSYTLEGGELNQEKIVQQSYSFSKKN